MAKKRTSSKPVPATTDAAYEAVLAGVIQLLESARHAAARSVNAVMTVTYWEVGRRIVEEEQRGKDRAGYGEQPITQMARDLTHRCGRGFGYRNLYQMRQFYMTYPRILQTASAKSGQGASSGEPARRPQSDSYPTKNSRQFDSLRATRRERPFPWQGRRIPAPAVGFRLVAIAQCP
jgi:hypothetical protein